MSLTAAGVAAAAGALLSLAVGEDVDGCGLCDWSGDAICDASPEPLTVFSELWPEPNESEAPSRVDGSAGPATPPEFAVDAEDAELDVDVIDVDVLVELDVELAVEVDVELDVPVVDCDVFWIVTTDVVDDTPATDVEDTVEADIELAVDVVLDVTSSTAACVVGGGTATSVTGTSVTGARASETVVAMLLASAPAAVAALAACGTTACSTQTAIPTRTTTRRRIFIRTK